MHRKIHDKDIAWRYIKTDCYNVRYDRTLQTVFMLKVVKKKKIKMVMGCIKVGEVQCIATEATSVPQRVISGDKKYYWETGNVLQRQGNILEVQYHEMNIGIKTDAQKKLQYSAVLHYLESSALSLLAVA